MPVARAYLSVVADERRLGRELSSWAASHHDAVECVRLCFEEAALQATRFCRGAGVPSGFVLTVLLSEEENLVVDEVWTISQLVDKVDLRDSLRDECPHPRRHGYKHPERN